MFYKSILQKTKPMMMSHRTWKPVPICFTDNDAPLSDSEEDSMADASIGAASDVEDIQVVHDHHLPPRKMGTG